MTPRYRAWDNVKKEMFKDTFAITESGQVVVVEQESVASSPDYVFVDHLVIMQSTGLRDKNGKEIFEGDFLELKDCGETIGNVKVYWDDSLALFQLDAIIVDEKVPIYKVVDDENYSYIVAGNIYENPELLEVTHE